MWQWESSSVSMLGACCGEDGQVVAEFWLLFRSENKCIICYIDLACMPNCIGRCRTCDLSSWVLLFRMLDHICGCRSKIILVTLYYYSGSHSHVAPAVWFLLFRIFWEVSPSRLLVLLSEATPPASAVDSLLQHTDASSPPSIRSCSDIV
jgi:hypothetical protein